MTQDEVMAAQPEIEKRVEQMVSNHRWMPPGYKVCSHLITTMSTQLLIPLQEKFGDLSVM